MPDLLTLHSAVTWTLVGLIHTIQWVHYPLFKNVGSQDFPEFHRQHTTRITRLVAPLMVLELLTAAWMLVKNTPNSPLFLASLPPLALIWISTALLQVPLHNGLASGFNQNLHRRLVRTNHIRTVAWTLRALLLLASQTNERPQTPHNRPPTGIISTSTRTTCSPSPVNTPFNGLTSMKSRPTAGRTRPSNHITSFVESKSTPPFTGQNTHTQA